jgi:hypothetical protein
MTMNCIHYMREDFPIPQWTISMQTVGGAGGYVPFHLHGSGRHVMDDFGSLVESLPMNQSWASANLREWQIDY